MIINEINQRSMKINRNQSKTKRKQIKSNRKPNKINRNQRKSMKITRHTIQTKDTHPPTTNTSTASRGIGVGGSGVAGPPARRALGRVRPHWDNCRYRRYQDRVRHCRRPFSPKTIAKPAQACPTVLLRPPPRKAQTMQLSEIPLWDCALACILAIQGHQNLSERNCFTWYCRLRKQIFDFM